MDIPRRVYRWRNDPGTQKTRSILPHSARTSSSRTSLLLTLKSCQDAPQSSLSSKLDQSSPQGAPSILETLLKSNQSQSQSRISSAQNGVAGTQGETYSNNPIQILNGSGRDSTEWRGLVGSYVSASNTNQTLHFSNAIHYKIRFSGLRWSAIPFVLTTQGSQRVGNNGMGGEGVLHSPQYGEEMATSEDIDGGSGGQQACQVWEEHSTSSQDSEIHPEPREERLWPADLGKLLVE